jgi:hypothetical protein
MWLHTLYPDGVVKGQGQILAVGNHLAAVQFYHLFTGAATRIETMAMTAICDESRCCIYPTLAHMHYDRAVGMGEAQ